MTFSYKKPRNVKKLTDCTCKKWCVNMIFKKIVIQLINKQKSVKIGKFFFFEHGLVNYIKSENLTTNS